MTARVLVGHLLNRLREIPDEYVHMVVTSPPYWNLRDYGTAVWIGGDPQCDHKPQGNWRDPKKNPAILSSNGHGPKSGKLGRDCPCGAVRVDEQLGLEATPCEYIEKCVLFFREIRRVLRSDGTCWVNMGDSYAGAGLEGFKPKDLCGMPWRLAFALQDDGWYLRQDIIWNKNNPMPESVSDRCTKSHEYIFLLSKSESYFFDAEAIKEKASTNTHSRGGGVNPKATKEGQHSRMRGDRDPKHTGGLPFKRKDRVAHAGHPVQSGLAKLSNHHGGGVAAKMVDAAVSTRFGRGPGWRSKQNESFSAAVNDIVAHRNKRSVWTFATAPFKKAHFATFPPTLPRLCIKAGTSAKGCCSVCGRPFERIVEKYDTGVRQKMADGWDTGEGGHGSIHREGREKGETEVPVIATRTIGWRENCCDLFGGHAVPCTVFDPFAGAGTTGLVAAELGRDFLGCELSPEYAELIRERLGNVEIIPSAGPHPSPSQTEPA